MNPQPPLAGQNVTAADFHLFLHKAELDPANRPFACPVCGTPKHSQPKPDVFYCMEHLVCAGCRWLPEAIHAAPAVQRLCAVAANLHERHPHAYLVQIPPQLSLDPHIRLHPFTLYNPHRNAPANGAQPLLVVFVYCGDVFTRVLVCDERGIREKTVSLNELGIIRMPFFAVCDDENIADGLRKALQTRASKPSNAEWERVLPLVHYECNEPEPKRRRLRRHDDNMTCTLFGICCTKGYALTLPAPPLEADTFDSQATQPDYGRLPTTDASPHDFEQPGPSWMDREPETLTINDLSTDPTIDITGAHEVNFHPPRGLPEVFIDLTTPTQPDAEQLLAELEVSK